MLLLIFLGLCVVDEECDATEKCYSGKCLKPCDLEKTCGMNAICRTDNHIVQCSCPYSFTGNQAVECVRSKYFRQRYYFIPLVCIF